MIRKQIAVALASIVISACSGLPLRESGTVPAKKASARMSCLAISAGGERSGAVGLGAIQGLYEKQALENFEFVSTVSGGGYPVYGLLERMIRDKMALRDLLREHGKFIADVERNADFIGPTGLYFWLPFQALDLPLALIERSSGSLQTAYIVEIDQTFGGRDVQPSGRRSFDRARDIRKIQGFPMPIFGASASIGTMQPGADHEYTFDYFFELSPDVSGAPAIGYFSDFSRKVTTGEAVAISAAALDLPLAAKVLNIGVGSSFQMRAASGQDVNFHLADGGFTEKLALLPLLRRGCTEILVFDSSGSDDGTAFQAWNAFTSRLPQEAGWKISEGGELRAVTSRQLPPERAEQLWDLPHHVWEAELQQDTRRAHIQLIRLGVDRGMRRHYPPEVQRFMEQNWNGSTPACRGSPPDERCSFPLESTYRQSFTPEEFRAYRLLGRWLAKLAVCTRSMETATTDVVEEAKVIPCISKRGL